MFTSKTQAVNAVANLIVTREPALTGLVNGLLGQFGYSPVEAPIQAKETAAPVRKAKIAPVKSARSGRTYLSSTNLDYIDFTPARRFDARRPNLKRTKSKLVVTFLSGAVYEYTGVPLSVVTGLVNADSAGSFFNDEIRDQYPTKKLSGSQSATA